MIHASNLTIEAYYKLNGTLTNSMIEELLDLQVAVEGGSGVLVHIGEASGCYPEEDFLSNHIEGLRAISRRLRGQNKADLEEAIRALEGLETSTQQETEYGISELDAAEKSTYVM